ncbi:Retrograde regulation protein 2 [Sphaceloma murrayae]|uniref:Retrograde regulation protein 2 n=1 Tax=Sphaceloma murrayae TaxID=2082308 RepID=A0A2K1QXJ3_9PEZI|nr:Retrograde regulation protein 2 [Sphaceloma murrayae]
MSSDTAPIPPEEFARALESLPPETLHQRAAEIQNSINHLKYSNEQMMPFADEGDHDCREAMFENLVVIGRMNERIKMVREEVEKRGLRWADAEVEEAEGEKVNGHIEGQEPPVAGSQAPAQEVAPSGRLTDEQLRRRLEEQMAGDEEEGVHL